MTVQRILNAQQNRATAYIAPDAVIADVLHSLAFEDVGALVVSAGPETLCFLKNIPLEL